MRRFIKLFLISALVLPTLVSCQKSLSKSIVGNYYFKVSGRITGFSIDEEGPSEAIDLSTFRMSGQMEVIDTTGGYIARLSVMLGGPVLLFPGTIEGEDIKFDDASVPFTVKDSATASTVSNSTGSVIYLNVYGQGRLYDGTLIVDLHCSDKSFAYKSKIYEIDEFEVDLVADKE